jgi:prevent-host-death family protein
MAKFMTYIDTKYVPCYGLNSDGRNLMITVNDKTTIAAISELRNKSEEILKQLADHRVILQRHNKPVAVMIGYRQYEQLSKLLDRAEEYVLGMTALERDKKAGKKDFVDIEHW